MNSGRMQKYREEVEKTTDYVLSGHTLEETAKKLKIAKDTVKNRIEALNDVAKETYNPEKYATIQNILASFDAQKAEEKARQLEEEKEKILDLFRKGKSLSYVERLGHKKELCVEIYKGLNDINSPYYEPETYLYTEEKKKENKERYRTNFEFSNTAKVENSVFEKFSLNTQREILLMALTFRVSYKTLAKMFGTVREDVVQMVNKYSDLRPAMDWLDKETMSESSRFEFYAYRRARKYWDERNEIIKKDKNSKEEFKEKMRELHSQIDDSIVSSVVEKRNGRLTPQEREMIARYRLKYGLPMVACAEQLCFDRKTISQVSEELAIQDPVFRVKIEQLNDYFHIRNYGYTSTREDDFDNTMRR